MPFRIKKIEHYRKTGELSSGLLLDATLATEDAKHNWQNRSPDIVEIEKLYLADYQKVMAEQNAIHLKAKEFEFKHWMGFCDTDVAELLQMYQDYSSYRWNREDILQEDFWQNLWNPSPSCYRTGSYQDEIFLWEEFFARRNRPALQQTMEAQNYWGSAELSHVKVTMGSSAGRVLLSIQDRFGGNHPESKHGGAWISLIFDESAVWPRGGVQGLCATKDEALGLLQTIIDNMPLLQPNPNLAIC